MIYNRFSRRMFLQGSGQFLFAMPLLQSLVPKAYAQAAEAPIRYIQIFNPFNVGPQLYWGGSGSFGLNGWDGTPITRDMLNPQFLASAPADIEKHIRTLNLSSRPAGKWSEILTANLTAHRNKFTLIRGIDMQEGPHLAHNNVYGSCASYTINGQIDSAPPQPYHESIDTILKRSALVYPPDYRQTRRLISIVPGKGYDGAALSHSWEQNGAKTENVALIAETQALFNEFLSTPDGASPGRQPDVMNALYRDYQRVRDNNRISADDKVRLESYMSLIADIQKSLTAIGSGGACQTFGQSDLVPEATPEDIYRNQFRIVAAAMACGLSRVASIYMTFDRQAVDDMHGVSHNLNFSDPNSIYYERSLRFVANLNRFGDRVALLLSAMDSIPEGSGTLLDNSIVYWTMQFGHPQGFSTGHERDDFPIFVAGGAGGKLQTGKFIDYRLRSPNNSHWPAIYETGVPKIPAHPWRGLPMNNVLVTFMNCMGLSSQHYERAADPGKGFGWYAENPEGPRYPEPRIPHETFWRSTAGRRSALPYFYKGNPLG